MQRCRQTLALLDEVSNDQLYVNALTLEGSCAGFVPPAAVELLEVAPSQDAKPAAGGRPPPKAPPQPPAPPPKIKKPAPAPPPPPPGKPKQAPPPPPKAAPPVPVLGKVSGSGTPLLEVALLPMGEGGRCLQS